MNLLATLLLVTKERARDFAIFKAVGLTPRGVLGVVNAGGAALGAIAIVVGIPLGLVMFRAVMTAMSPRAYGRRSNNELLTSTSSADMPVTSTGAGDGRSRTACTRCSPADDIGSTAGTTER